MFKTKDSDPFKQLNKDNNPWRSLHKQCRDSLRTHLKKNIESLKKALKRMGIPKALPNKYSIPKTALHKNWNPLKDALNSLKMSRFPDWLTDPLWVLMLFVAGRRCTPLSHGSFPLKTTCKETLKKPFKHSWRGMLNDFLYKVHC